MKKELGIRQRILETYPDETFIFADGLDDAILGVEEETMGIIYSVKKARKIIISQMDVSLCDLTEDEIESGMTVRDKKIEIGSESFEFNTRGTKGLKWVWCDDELNF